MIATIKVWSQFLHFKIRKAKEVNQLFLFQIGYMRSFFINKNLSLYYWLKHRVGKDWALRVSSTAERIILIFGREKIG